VLRSVAILLTCSLLLPAIVGCNHSVTQPPVAQAAEATESHAPAPADEGPQPTISDGLQKLFARLDSLGRDKVRDAKFVTLEFCNVDEPARSWSEKAWLISQTDESALVLKEDLIPWTYKISQPTTVPSSWSPRSVRLKSITEASFEDTCKELSEPRKQSPDDQERIGRSLRAPGPSHRLLLAHAAWKRGLTKYCESILSNGPDYEKEFQEYRLAVLEDLAWLHFLRGVNLLMYADRREVLPHLQLVLELSPEGKYAQQSQDLLKHLKRLVIKEGDEADDTVDESERAKLYISSLKDIRCPQMAQPGFIMPYLAIVDGKPDQHPPTTKLKEMGMKAVPALIEALEDDTPTRTVYHWRDFARSRRVWRVSDFAWHILRDITKREFGYRRIVGFTFGAMEADEKQRVIEEIKRWYAANKTLSPDDRMFASFSSHNSDDWITAGKYFLRKKDQRAVEPLLKRIPQAPSFAQGDLCQLVAKFGDPSAKQAIKQVMETASEHAVRLSAAIALWTLGDNSGIPVVVRYVKAEKQPYGSWDEPIWLLMKTRSEEGMEALKSVVEKAPARRAGEVIGFITASTTGDLWGEEREPAGCVEICPVLIAAMNRSDYTGGTINNIKIRIKDSAAKAFALLKEGTDDRFGGRFVRIDPDVFNEVEPDEAKRDAQIEALKEWYEKNKDRLVWDSKKGKLALKPGP